MGERKRPSECAHENTKPYHDQSTLCLDCKSIIEQRGKRIENPQRLDGLDDLYTEAKHPTCKWTDCTTRTETACGGAVVDRNGYVYCPYCGGKIEDASDD